MRSERVDLAVDVPRDLLDLAGIPVKVPVAGHGASGPDRMGQLSASL